MATTARRLGSGRPTIRAAVPAGRYAVHGIPSNTDGRPRRAIRGASSISISTPPPAIVTTAASRSDAGSITASPSSSDRAWNERYRQPLRSGSVRTAPSDPGRIRRRSGGRGGSFDAWIIAVIDLLLRRSEEGAPDPSRDDSGRSWGGARQERVDLGWGRHRAAAHQPRRDDRPGRVAAFERGDR